MKKGKSWVIILVAVICIGLLGWYSTAVITDTKQKQEATANGESTKDKDYQNIKLGLDLSGGVSITYHIKDKNPSDKDVNDTIAKLEERAESYTTEYSVYKSGDDRITVEIPGVDDPNKVLEDLGSPGSLYFIAQYDSDGNANYTQDTSVEGGYKLNYDIDTLKANGSVILDGNDVKDASAQYDQSSSTSTKEPVVSLKLKDKAIDTWADATKKAKDAGQSIGIYYDDHFISVPTVSAVISDGNCVINGMKDYDEATSLATFIRVGAINLQLEELESNVVGAQLGGTALTNAVKAAIIGIILIMIFMIVLYGILGVVASIGLALYSMLTVLFIYWFEITLTLPGIAGIILGIGMAVDANVLIYERTKEELRAGKGVKKALADGYSNAFSAIFDSNLTSIITGIILFNFGTGPIRGFATTLIIGILVSFFTAVFMTRLVYEHFMNKDKWLNLTFTSKISRNLLVNTRFDFMGTNKKSLIIVSAIILVCIGSFALRGLSQSIDFTGGRNFKVQFENPVEPEQVRELIADKFGEDVNVNVIAIGTDKKTVRISTNYRIADEGNNVDSEIESYLYETLKPLLTQNITLATFIDRDNHTGGSIVSSQKVGPSIADDIKTGAVWSVVLALIAIGLYILIRFRNIAYSIGSIVALTCDTIMIIGAYSLLWGIVPFSLEIDQTFIGAILTAIGYSINDKVVIFDRVREFFGLYPKRDKRQLFNDSLNTTLARTINTSLSTLIVLLCIFILGGDSIRSFAFAMILGVVIGTLSSLFIASPIAYNMMKNKKVVVAATEE